MIDVGLRTEPNLELLTEMKPSFIWSAGYGPSPRNWRIAPEVARFLATAKAAGGSARRSLVEPAQTLNLEAAAENIWRNTTFHASQKPHFIRRGGVRY